MPIAVPSAGQKKETDGGYDVKMTGRSTSSGQELAWTYEGSGMAR